MSLENYQNNLRYELCTDSNDPTGYETVDGKVKYTIEDKTQPLKDAHVFYTNFIEYDKDETKMVQKIFEDQDYCDWLINNRSRIRNYFEGK